MEPMALAAESRGRVGFWCAPTAVGARADAGGLCCTIKKKKRGNKRRRGGLCLIQRPNKRTGPSCAVKVAGPRAGFGGLGPTQDGGKGSS